MFFTSKCNIIAFRSENMLKTTAMLLNELSEYVNPEAKIRRDVRDGKIFTVVRGLYETDKDTPGHLLAGAIYGPSYLSFEYALSHYGFIPERVYYILLLHMARRKRSFIKRILGSSFIGMCRSAYIRKG